MLLFRNISMICQFVMAQFRRCRAQVVDEKKTFKQDKIHINIGAMSHTDHEKITFTPAITRNETIKEEMPENFTYNSQYFPGLGRPNT